MISVFWIGTFTMVMMVVGLLYLAVFYQKRLTKFKMEEAELLLKKSLESEKEERKRISIELHDGVQGDLVAAKNFLYLLKMFESEEDKDLVVKETKEVIENAINNIRLLSQKLMPPLLINGGLVLAINDYFETLNKSTYKSFILDTELLSFTVSESVSYELFRIIQEFSTNFIKHGDSDQFLVALISQDSTNYIIEIVDNGKSFNFKELYNNSNGNGLKNIQSRINVMNAILQQREVLIGNHFSIQIPV